MSFCALSTRFMFYLASEALAGARIETRRHVSTLRHSSLALTAAAPNFGRMSCTLCCVLQRA